MSDDPRDSGTITPCWPGIWLDSTAESLLQDRSSSSIMRVRRRHQSPAKKKCTSFFHLATRSPAGDFAAWFEFRLAVMNHHALRAAYSLIGLGQPDFRPPDLLPSDSLPFCRRSGNHLSRNGASTSARLSIRQAVIQTVKWCGNLWSHPVVVHRCGKARCQ